MYKYKTKDGVDLTIVGVGRTVNGEITTDVFIESPALELIEDNSDKTKQPVYPAIAHMNGVVNQDEQPFNGENKSEESDGSI